MTSKLNVGILINSYQLSDWVYTIIASIQQSDYAQITLVVKNESDPAHEGSKLQQLIRKRSQIVHKAHTVIDSKLFGRRATYGKEKDISPILQNVDEIKVIPKLGKFTDRLIAEDIQKIKVHELDVILRFGFRILKGDIFNCANYGVWSYHHGDNRENRGGPPGYWESVENWGTSGFMLQILNEDLDGGKVIHRSNHQTDALSIEGNKDNFYWRSSNIVPRILKGMHQYGPEYLEQRIARYNKDITAYDKPLYRTPGNFKAFKNLLKFSSNLVRRTFRKLFYYNYWYVMVKPLKQSDEVTSFSLRKFKALHTTSNKYWADPFILTKHNKHYMFVEEYIWKTNKAHISIVELDEKGNYLTDYKIIDPGYHLSYPFVFKHNNTLYLIPESRSNRTIELYKCVEFPDKWEFDMNLMEHVDAVDTTLHFDGTLWWLFCNYDETGGKSSCADELHIFYASDFRTQNWTPHKHNPVVSDCRLSRPAGKLFTLNNQLYRPSQCSEYIYGKACNIFKIKTLTETEYEEELVTTMHPEWNKAVQGIHTFNYSEKLAVVDAFMYRPKFTLKPFKTQF
ncbi:MAG: hypothetical protein AAF901_10400 [Bacteroidota bacterium]